MTFVDPKAFDGVMKFFGFLLVVGIPLAIWKLVDIAIWILNHVEIGFK